MTERYAELHAHSGFSFLDGGSDPEELVAEAHRLGLDALALTDHHGFYGVVRFAEAARAVGLPTVFGTEVTLAPASPRTGEPDPTGAHLLVLARDPAGYARLSTVLADAHLAGGEKGKPVFTLDALARAADGHWVVLSGCRKGAVPAALMEAGPGAASRQVGHLVEAFGRANVALELWDHGDPVDTARNDALARLAVEWGVDAVATNNVHYATPAGFRLATTLAAVRARRPLAELEGWLPPAPVACLRSGAEQRRRFARWPGVVERAAELGRACAFDLRLVAPRLPDFPVPAGMDEQGYLRQLVPEGAHGPLRAARGRAGAGGVEPDRARARRDRPARLRRLLPRRVGHRAGVQAAEHLLPGPWLGRQLGRLLRARRHQRGRGRPRPVVRALLVPGARRAAGHRRGHRVGAPRGGDPVRVRALRPAPRRAGGQRHHLPAPLGRARRRQGVRLHRRAGGRLVGRHRRRARARAVVDRRGAGGRGGGRGGRGGLLGRSGSRRWSPSWRPRCSTGRATSASTRPAWCCATGRWSRCARWSGGAWRAAPCCSGTRTTAPPSGW